jgi:peptidoglycan/LPS O-acetylase OafA/YrhL
MQERWRSLDGIRGLAIMLVVTSHAFPATYGVGGSAGVALFFVLSGFLITSLLLRENETNGRIDLKKFYGRRALRLAPALVVYLIVVAIAYGWSSIWAALFYVGNYAQIAGADVGLNVHTWSLAVEEHFYLLWPVVFVFLAAVPQKRRLVWVVSATILSLGWRFIVPDAMWAYQATDTNAYALALGCVVALVRDSWTPSRRVANLSLVGVVALGFYPMASLEEFLGAGRWVAPVAAVLGGIAVWASATHAQAWLASPLMVRAGKVSYALYLWHPAVLFVFWSRIGGERAIVSLGAIVVSIGLAALSWRYVEAPILGSRWASRLRVQRSQVALNPEGRSTECLLDAPAGAAHRV